MGEDSLPSISVLLAFKLVTSSILLLLLGAYSWTTAVNTSDFRTEYQESDTGDVLQVSLNSYSAPWRMEIGAAAAAQPVCKNQIPHYGINKVYLLHRLFLLP